MIARRRAVIANPDKEVVLEVLLAGPVGSEKPTLDFLHCSSI